jgi:hypothetical protein
MHRLRIQPPPGIPFTFDGYGAILIAFPPDSAGAVRDMFLRVADEAAPPAEGVAAPASPPPTTCNECGAGLDEKAPRLEVTMRALDESSSTAYCDSTCLGKALRQVEEMRAAMEADGRETEGAVPPIAKNDADAGNQAST